MLRVLHKMCYVSKTARCSDAFKRWMRQTQFKYSKGVDLSLRGSERLDEVMRKNEELRKELVYFNEKIEH